MNHSGIMNSNSRLGYMHAYYIHNNNINATACATRSYVNLQLGFAEISRD